MQAVCIFLEKFNYLSYNITRLRSVMMTRYDIAIIGTGPAGLEAAITAKVRNKNIILFGSKDLSQKMQVVKHPILNYLGLPSKTGVE
ncbi:MAG: thioredoxin reductase, partial [Solobacterium sp.]|nr:thioredoxin reductase [Solobacterium sp.]